jgi:hypothetical protein
MEEVAVVVAVVEVLAVLAVMAAMAVMVVHQRLFENCHCNCSPWRSTYRTFQTCGILC